MLMPCRAPAPTKSTWAITGAVLGILVIGLIGVGS